MSAKNFSPRDLHGNFTTVQTIKEFESFLEWLVDKAPVNKEERKKTYISFQEQHQLIPLESKTHFIDQVCGNFLKTFMRQSTVLANTVIENNYQFGAFNSPHNGHSKVPRDLQESAVQCTPSPANHLADEHPFFVSKEQDIPERWAQNIYKNAHNYYYLIGRFFCAINFDMVHNLLVKHFDQKEVELLCNKFELKTHFAKSLIKLLAHNQNFEIDEKFNNFVKKSFDKKLFSNHNSYYEKEQNASSASCAFSNLEQQNHEYTHTLNAQNKNTTSLLPLVQYVQQNLAHENLHFLLCMKMYIESGCAINDLVARAVFSDENILTQEQKDINRWRKTIDDFRLAEQKVSTERLIATFSERCTHLFFEIKISSILDAQNQITPTVISIEPVKHILYKSSNDNMVVFLNTSKNKLIVGSIISTQPNIDPINHNQSQIVFEALKNVIKKNAIPQFLEVEQIELCTVLDYYESKPNLSQKIKHPHNIDSNFNQEQLEQFKALHHIVENHAKAISPLPNPLLQKKHSP